MILYIDRDEVFPVYTIYKKRYSEFEMTEIELSEPEYAAYMQAREAYEEWQSKLMQIWKEKERQHE